MDQKFLREELRSTGYNFSKTARALGVDYGALRNRFDNQRQQPVVVPSGPIPSDPKTLGRVGMAHMVIAVKPNGGAWPTVFFNAIQAARAKYDAGTHEMAQEKRKDGWVVLYSIPRLVAVKRRPYFSRRDYEG